MEMPTPTVAQRRLAKFAGNWSGTETMHPSPWDPAGYSATGHVRNHLALDGFVLIQDYEQRRDGKAVFKGHGVFAFDPHANHYTLHWFDSMGSPVNVYTGTFDADVLSMTSPAHGGHSRCRFDFSQADAYTFEMAMSEDGKRWTVLMEGSYTKSK